MDLKFLLVASSPQRFDPSVDDVHGKWKYYNGVFLHVDLRQCLQVAKLDGCRLCFEDGGGFGQLGRGLELSFGVDDFCATLAFGLRLPRDGSLHRLRNIHLFDFHFRYLDTLGLGILINDYLQLRVYLMALRIESVLFLEFYLGFDVA